MEELTILQLNEYGFVLKVDTKINLTKFNKVSLIVRKPDKTIVEWEGMVWNEYPTCIIYTVQEGDLDQVGIYTLHAKTEAADMIRIGRICRFYVTKLHLREYIVDGTKKLLPVP